MRCEVCECFNKANEYSDCYHVPLCDDHYDELMTYYCNNENCDWHIKVCETCLDINGKQCDCDDEMTH